MFDLIEASGVTQMVLVHVDGGGHIFKIKTVLTLSCPYHCVLVRLTYAALCEVSYLIDYFY